MKLRALRRIWPVMVLSALLPLSATAATLAGAAALHSLHANMDGELVRNAFGEPLVIRSQEGSRSIDGHAYATLDTPFAQVAAVLQSRTQWCELLMLHLNNKYCRTTDEDGMPRVELFVGRKGEQPVRSATRMRFIWLQPLVRADYAAAQMAAPDGPYDTRDYTLVAEAVPLQGGKTFIHLGYGFTYGGTSHFAMHLYLSTIGRDKVGFSREPAPADGTEPGHVRGMRGVIERNVMRYLLALRSHLDAAHLPSDERTEARLRAWFDATEKHPKQLHEIEREDYLKMKQNEFRRLAAAP